MFDVHERGAKILHGFDADGMGMAAIQPDVDLCACTDEFTVPLAQVAVPVASIGEKQAAPVSTSCSAGRVRIQTEKRCASSAPTLDVVLSHRGPRKSRIAPKGFINGNRSLHSLLEHAPDGRNSPSRNGPRNRTPAPHMMNFAVDPASTDETSFHPVGARHLLAGYWGSQVNLPRTFQSRPRSSGPVWMPMDFSPAGEPTGQTV